MSWWVSSEVNGPAKAEPQPDWSSGPVMVTGLVSGCSSAAFRGLMELNRTTERQPVKPREPSLSRSGSKSSDPGDRHRKTEKHCGQRSSSQAPPTHDYTIYQRSSSAPNTGSRCSHSPWTLPKTTDLMALNSPSDVRLKSSLGFWSIWNNQKVLISPLFTRLKCALGDTPGSHR